MNPVMSLLLVVGMTTGAVGRSASTAPATATEPAAAATPPSTDDEAAPSPAPNAEPVEAAPSEVPEAAPTAPEAEPAPKAIPTPTPTPKTAYRLWELPQANGKTVLVEAKPAAAAELLSGPAFARGVKPGTLKMTFEGTALGDYPHIFVVDGKKRRRDFGRGRNALEGSALAGWEMLDERALAKLKGKRFLVTWDFVAGEFLYCEGEDTLYLGVLPSITKLAPARWVGSAEEQLAVRTGERPRLCDRRERVAARRAGDLLGVHVDHGDVLRSLEHQQGLLSGVTRDREPVLGASTVEAPIRRRQHPALHALRLERAHELLQAGQRPFGDDDGGDFVHA